MESKRGIVADPNLNQHEVSMPTLVVANRSFSIPGLGKHQEFSRLSEKRVTKAVRAMLREHFQTIEVSCSASLVGAMWTGECLIEDVPYPYRVVRN